MVKPLSPIEMMTIIDDAIDKYHGDVSVLESSIGALVFGNKFGWRVLRISHSSHSYGKYEKILGLKFKEVCPEYTELSSRSVALNIANSMGKFWDLANGRVPFEGKGDKRQINLLE